MKIKDLRLLYGVTLTLKLAKVDKDIATSIITNHIAAAKAVKEADADFEEAKKAIFKGLETKQNELAQLREKYAAAKTDAEKAEILEKAGKYMDVINAEKTLMESYKNIQDKDVDVKLSMIELDKYMEALAEAKIDYTAQDIENSQIIIKQ